MNTSDPAAKRGPGRPRTRPTDLVRHRLDLTPAETDEVQTAAAAAGTSMSEFSRAAVLAAARKSAAKKSR